MPNPYLEAALRAQDADRPKPAAKKAAAKKTTAGEKPAAKKAASSAAKPDSTADKES